MTTAQASSAIHTALSPAEVRLLLLLSRPKLTDSQQRIAASLIPKIKNWPAVIGTAWRKYVLHMVYQNLSALQCSPPPEDVLRTMRELSMRVTAEMLRRQAAFHWFHSNCVLPSGVEHAYFKGPALAARFYPDPMQRFYSDIDILVRRDMHLTLLHAARARGCKIYAHVSFEEAAINLDNEKEVAEFFCLTKVPHIVTPQGVVVELHSEIDDHTSVFDTNTLLRSNTETTTQNFCVKTIPDTWHFVFICYHHTKHLWSRLNWLADLDAICNSHGFDRAEALHLGRTLKIESTVMAALDFHELASKGHHPSDFDHTSPGVDLLSACVANLAGDLALEQKLRRNQRFGVINFTWQEVPLSNWRKLLHTFRLMKPTYADFCAVPCVRSPFWLRYGLAIRIKLKRSSLRRLKETFGS